MLAHLPTCEAGDRRYCGNIILLHDGGGDRSETVKALPMIIEGIRANGLQIVSVSDLLHMTRAQIMPPLSTGERWSAELTGLGFWLFGRRCKVHYPRVFPRRLADDRALAVCGLVCDL